MPSLIIQERGTENAWSHECAEAAITIGRHASNTIQLPASGVSRRHAKIISEGENLYLIDLESGNGTSLNGTHLKANEKNLLCIGDTILIDSYDIRVNSGEVTFKGFVDDEVTENDILEIKLLKKVLTALDRDISPSIEVLNGTGEGKKIFLAEENAEVTIGRDPECEFPLNEHVISRRHAQISRRWGGISIRDLESKNGTFVNSRRVVEEFLHDGDRIALGTIVFMFRNPQEINLANLEELQPKNKPQEVSPSDIPGIDESSEPAIEEEAPSTDEAQEQTPQEEERDDWNDAERDEPQLNDYPTPKPKKDSTKILTLFEMGMIGLGGIILLLAILTIVNILFS